MKGLNTLPPLCNDKASSNPVSYEYVMVSRRVIDLIENVVTAGILSKRLVQVFKAPGSRAAPKL